MARAGFHLFPYPVLSFVPMKFLLGMLGALFLMCGYPSGSAWAIEEVVVVNSTFSPDYVEVRSCEGIRFINLDLVAHHLTYEAYGADHTEYLLGFGLVGVDEPDTAELDLKKGTYLIYCLPHPWMKPVKVMVDVDDEACRAYWAE
ncbi:hypothetical protein UR09_06485 [Candidatus Nitromaritima sp. SCGC AAA799-A02]|nr:hypothetical protein UR09_06485 [Candidatus Nitromaritima sp. SCGC AAA799-A02]KMP10382.1 hypothetical protein UZ36_07810 [Candidatus Nitromaritima sp. SCGC AAA799-C22]